VICVAFFSLSDLEKAMSDSSDATIYRSCGSKAMRMKGACRGMQRCERLERGFFICRSASPPRRGDEGRRRSASGDDLEEDEEVTPSKYYIVKPTLC
jgi:hypothetical protein